MDAAGTVESVGAGVERLAVGDEVMAAVMPRRPEGGAQAELVVLPAASVVPIPQGATLEQAATLPMNGLTALRGLELLDLEPGATLGVTGGAGLLASYVIPLAKLRGLRVLADAGPADAELVRGFGADVVLPRGDDLPEAMRAAAPGGVDAVFDTAVLGRGIFAAIRPGGALAFVRTWDGDDVEDGIEIHRVLVAGGARADGLAARAERPRSPRRARAARRRHVPARAGRRRAPADGGRRPARPRRHRLRLTRACRFGDGLAGADVSPDQLREQHPTCISSPAGFRTVSLLTRGGVRRLRSGGRQ